MHFLKIYRHQLLNLIKNNEAICKVIKEETTVKHIMWFFMENLLQTLMTYTDYWVSYIYITGCFK